jgi:hypothetical protein
MQSPNTSFYKYVLRNIDFDLMFGAPSDFYLICDTKIMPAIVLTYLAKRCGDEPLQIRKSEIADALLINESMVFSCVKYLKDMGFISTTFAKESEPPYAPLLVFRVNHDKIKEAISCL